MPHKQKNKRPRRSTQERAEDAVALLTHCPQSGHRLATTWDAETEKITGIYCPACGWKLPTRAPITVTKQKPPFQREDLTD